MEKINAKEVKSKNPENFKRACIYTNIAYALVEAADSFLVDVNSILKPMGACVSKDEKLKFKRALHYGKFFKINIHEIAEQIYKINNESNNALDDADEVYDTIKLIMDRCGGNMDKLSCIKEAIYNDFESIYNFYEKH